MIAPREVDKPLVLYGYGKLGHLAGEIFKEIGVSIEGIMDGGKIILRTGKCQSWDVPKDYLLAVCIASEPYKPIHDKLKSAGWTDIVPAWDILEYYADRTGIRNGWFLNGLNNEDREGLKRIVRGWADGASWYHHAAFGHWRIDHSEDVFWSWCPLEIKPSLPSTLADIRARQYTGIYEDMYVDGWPVLKNKTLSLHSEGCELDEIKANIKTFQNQRPKLEVACYHSRDGLWKIPKFLMDNLEDYEFEFRLHAYQGQGAYLYCTPKEMK